MTFRELCEREIVCVEDGKRLGHPCDIEFSQDGQICALLAAAPCDSLKKLFCRPDEYKILWSVRRRSHPCERLLPGGAVQEGRQGKVEERSGEAAEKKSMKKVRSSKEGLPFLDKILLHKRSDK